MADEVNLLVFAPTTWDSLGKAVDFTELAFDLPQVARLITSLISMVLVEMLMTIYFPSKRCSIVSYASLLFKLNNAD